jgi:hypothetical protein
MFRLIFPHSADIRLGFVTFSKLGSEIILTTLQFEGLQVLYPLSSNQSSQKRTYSIMVLTFCRFWSCCPV